MSASPHQISKATVYFDGACPLCQAEINHYRRLKGAVMIDFVDAAACAQQVRDDLSRETALARFHMRTRDGELLSGAKAFVQLWRHLPRWRWLSALAQVPGAMLILEIGYRLTLRARPALVWVYRQWWPKPPGGSRSDHPL